MKGPGVPPFRDTFPVGEKESSGRLSQLTIRVKLFNALTSISADSGAG